MLKIQNILLLIALLLTTSGLIGQQKNSQIDNEYLIDENGDRLVITRISGYPPEILPESNKELPTKNQKIPGEIFWLDNMPAYDWSYGCTPTAAAMISGYYDNTGVVNTYTGGITAVNGGLAPMSNDIWDGQTSQTGTAQCVLAGTKQGVDGRDKKGHGEDYWVNYTEESDPYYGFWTEHEYSETGYNHCVADYMGTNQWNNWENSDGSTDMWNWPRGQRMYDKSDEPSIPSRDGCHGLRLYWEALGYTVDTNYNQIILGYNDPHDNPDMGPTTEGFTFENYMDQIDRGYPVIINVVGHTMTGYGYDNTGENKTIYLMNTWNRNNTPGAYTMEWGASYSGMTHTGVTVVELGTECGWFAPRNISASNNDRTVTVNWDDPSKGAVANIEYELYRDGVQIATGITVEQYVDVYQGDGSMDGIHNYRLKSVYPNDSYATILSGDNVDIYVSSSITEFHDNFENGTGDWLLLDDWGLCQEYVHGGNNSLSESPNANYINGTEISPEGGSVAEIAKGFDFSTAADVNMDFWFRYDIENNFDYMYLQVSLDGINWTSIKTWTGTNTVWTQENISLGSLAGKTNVRVRFLFASDGYTVAEGGNIDDLNITPSSIDSSPPYVEYTNAGDYYDNNPNGYEITTNITDFTGINYARILYKVNGGSENQLNPSTVAGSEYSFIIPEQMPGSSVEFRFDCQDTSPASNQSYTEPFFYRAGLHQKYDNGTSNVNIPMLNTVSVEGDKEVAAVRFTSFHDDVVGVVLRGYDDATLPYDNSDLMIHVYADNNGWPGAELITPFSVPNPASPDEPEKWTYADLSGLGLADMKDYFIGVSSDNNVTGEMTRISGTDCNVSDAYNYGRTFSKGIVLGMNTWQFLSTKNYHIRAVTTNYEHKRPTIDPSLNELVKTLATNETFIPRLRIYNNGDYDLNYNATFEYISNPTKSKAIDWLRLDGGFTTSGTIASDSYGQLNIQYDSAGLIVEGEYKAIIHLTGTDASSADVNVTLTIDNLGSTQQTLAAVADAYVRDGTYANDNFGTTVDLVVKNDNSSYNR
ncbi:MAG: hypothetical protein GQ534_06315, partial [Candidatus Delongbacteria bacterium]|nr:hypothetical protein [Candidatus Delongbacteria bacterium]